MKKSQFAVLFAAASFATSAMGGDEKNPVHHDEYVFPTVNPMDASNLMSRPYSKDAPGYVLLEVFDSKETREDAYKAHLENFDRRNIRAKIPARDIDFNGRGPHYLKVYPVGGALGLSGKYCSVVIDAVDRKTYEVTNLIESTSNSDEAVYGNNHAIQKVLDGVAYNFRISKCESSWIFNKKDGFQMQVTQDLSNLPEFKAIKEMNDKRRQIQNLEVNSTSLSVRFIDYENEVEISDEFHHVPDYTTLHDGMERHESREIAFETGEDTGQEYSVSTVFGASVRNGIVKSFEEKYGQSRTMTLGVTLDGNVCNDWRVKKYETRRLGYFSAPRMGIEKEHPFSIVTKHRILPINLCDPKNKEHLSGFDM